MGKNQTITPTDQKQYTSGYNGTALKVIFVKGEIIAGSPLNAANIAARGNNFNWAVSTPLTQADEINQTFVQETNYGRQELGTGRIDVVFNLRANDQMPTWDSIRTESEMTILEVTGDDHVGTIDGIPTILNAFLGCRITNQSSATIVNQQKILSVDISFRQRLTGADFKKKVGDAFRYPASIS